MVSAYSCTLKYSEKDHELDEAPGKQPAIFHPMLSISNNLNQRTSNRFKVHHHIHGKMDAVGLVLLLAF